MDKKGIAAIIDHTLLRPEAPEGDVRRLCHEALLHGFCAVCVHPHFVALAAELLGGSAVKVATVVAFPLGMAMAEVKVYEAMQAALLGADEIDVVINISAAREGRFEQVGRELSMVVAATRGLVRKAIIETCYLSDDQKRAAAEAALLAGMEYVKTSTGFGPAGATVADVRLIKEVVADAAGIKAAGGIRTYEQAMRMVEAGATRLGTSSGPAMVAAAPDA